MFFRSCLLTALLIPTLLAVADSAERFPNVATEIRSVALGFKNHIVVGRWTPATVAWTGEEAVRIVVDSVDDEGRKTRYLSDFLTPISGKSQSHTVYFQVGKLNGSIRVFLESEDGETISDPEFEEFIHNNKPIVLKHSDRLVVTLGHPAGFEQRPSDRREDDVSLNRQDFLPQNYRVVNLESSEELPGESLAYRSVHALVMSDSFQVDTKQNEAIREWVERGGHLVICAGSRIDRFVENRSRGESKNTLSPLTEWIPCRFTGTEEISNLSGLEIYSGKNVRIRIDGYVTIATLRDPSESATSMGTVLASAMTVPIVVRQPYGFGYVTASGLNFSEGPLTRWPSASVVAQKMMGDSDKSDSKTVIRARSISHSGISDVKSQLVNAVDKFDDVTEFTAWHVMGILVLYILLLGPLDYFLVQKVWKKPYFTWISFPLLVVACCTIASWVAFSGKGNEIKLNKLDILDIDATNSADSDSDRNLVRGHSWFVFFNPEARKMNMRVSPDDSLYAKNYRGSDDSSSSYERISWTGLPEKTYSGMYRPAGLSFGKEGYEFDENGSKLTSFPFSTWSSKNFSASWFRKCKPIVESQLSSENLGLISGSIEHNFSVPIEDWILVYQNRVFLPIIESEDSEKPVMSPGVLFEISSRNMRARDIQAFLTRTSTKTVETKKAIGIGESIDEKKNVQFLISRFAANCQNHFVLRIGWRKRLHTIG